MMTKTDIACVPGMNRVVMYCEVVARCVDMPFEYALTMLILQIEK